MDKKVKIMARHQKQFLGQTGVHEEFDLALWDRLTIVISLLIVPIFASLILFFISEYVIGINKYTLNLINLWGVRFAIPLIGLIVLFARNGFHFVTNKMMTYYWLYVIWPIIMYLSTLNRSTTYSNVVNAVTVGQIVSLIFTIIINGLLIYFVIYKNQAISLMWKNTVNNKFIVLIAVSIMGILIYILLNYIFSLIQSQIDPSTSNNQQAIGFDKTSAFAIIKVFILSILIAPIIEEFVYRYLLQNVLYNKWYSIIFTTLMFAFAHIQATYDWSHFIIYLPLGIVNGLIYYYTRNIFIDIAVHFGTNLVAFIFLFTN